MTDDELDRLLRESRPRTAADDGWAETPDGVRALSAIKEGVGTRRRQVRMPVMRRPRLVGLGIGLAAATAAAVAVGLAAGPPPDRGPGVGRGGPGNGGPGPVPAQMALTAYTGCDAMLGQLRAHTARHVGPYGLRGGGGYWPYASSRGAALGRVPAELDLLGGNKSTQSAPAHSTTNTQEVGVGEPDIVGTDGRRVVSVSGGVLRLVDAATHKITGKLDLRVYAGADNAELLMSGDRVLVLLGDSDAKYYGGLARYPYTGTVGTSAGTTALLVELTDDEPVVIDTLHAAGEYVSARMVGDTARLVVQSRPDLTFKPIRGRHSRKQRIAENRAIVRRAPLAAWLPTYQVTIGGRATTRSVPCTAVSHPAHYTGASMLTVYTLALGGDFRDPEPISLTANGANVYASSSSLYVADSHSTPHDGERTKIHRFDITGTAKPRYLGSKAVPGSVLDSYSMSEQDGTLRIVTTQRGRRGTDTSVYVLDANTLEVDGSVSGLGRGEQVRAVRFLGPLGYVVTYKSIDPLLVIDLSDPQHPRVAGELRMPGYSDYLHPVGAGRLLGVGEDVTRSGRINGLQVSLFDVSSPAHPQRLGRVTRNHTPSESSIDPHAFLFWPAAGIAVIPIDSWTRRESGAALALRITSDRLAVLGTIRNPGGSANGYGTGIERTLVIGDELWTMSSSGLRVSDLHTLTRQAWVPFS